MNERARFLAIESVLIVVSILVAFAIDAWWEERGNQAEERRILESLKAEFLAVAERIPWFIDKHRESTEQSLALIQAMHALGPGGVVSVTARELDPLLQHNSTDPQRGALDAVLLSGELR